MNKEKIPTYDVVIIGAGLSGIGTAYHIQDKCPTRSFTVLEGRAAMGGTWDLFKYPGIRSDSDMYTLGFSFYPWSSSNTIAAGASILEYIKDTAKTFGIDKKIQYNHKVVDVAWSSEEQYWTLEIAAHEDVPHRFIRCQFLSTCCGYYNYEQGYMPNFPNQAAFQGPLIHPQAWDETLDYANKKVVVIGSGATAITLVPEMAKQAQRVTMLQRSPTYIINIPNKDKLVNLIKKIFPSQFAHTLSRWKNILISLALFKIARRWPQSMRKLLKRGIKKELGDKYVDKHFDPKYDPWDQRLCAIPDNDLFHAIKEEKVEIVTDTIQEFTANGIRLASGRVLEADIIVSATGLQIQLLGGMQARVDGKIMDNSKLHCYRGVMFSDVPNFAVAIGYTNASWTLKCDLNCHFITRVLNHMEQNKYRVCTPRFDSTSFETAPLLDFDAGYIQRANGLLPKQGSRAPWKVYQNYIRDTFSLKYGNLKDKYLEYK